MAASVGLLVIVGGCSKKDEILGDAQAAGVESALNDALATTVDPLVSFVGAIPAIANGGATSRAAFGLSCPDTSSVCGGGSVVCTVTGGSQYTFSFNQCLVVTGDATFTLDGDLVVTPGGTIYFSFNNLFINDSAMSGNGSVNPDCSYVVSANTPDSTYVYGTIVQCDSDNYPQGNVSHLTVSLESAVIDISFDGSAVASAVASSGGNTIAVCSINLAVHPFASVCSAP